MDSLLLNSDSDDSSDVSSSNVRDQDKITSGILNYTVSIYDNIASKHNKQKQT
jgi:hypothetical protein